jgi:GxxExxY protein
MEEGARLNQITGQIIGAAIAVHRALDPGLLESAYESCLVYELTQQGLKVESQKPLPVSRSKTRLRLSTRPAG